MSGKRLAKALELIRSKTNDRGYAKPLVALSYEHPDLQQEALVAVEKLQGPHGAIGRLSLAPVMDPETAHRLAMDAYRLLLHEIDHGKESDTWNADASWPRGPDHMDWCYIGNRRYAPVLVVECLRWMHPIEKARCVRELLARFRKIADNDAILATAATLAHELPTEKRADWAKKLSARRKDETNVITLASLAALLEGEERHALAIEAWKGSVATDTEQMAGKALTRASQWLTEEEREPLQIAAIERWNSSPKPPQAAGLADALCEALTLGSALSWIEKDSHEWVLEGLVPAIAKQEPARVSKHLEQSLRSLHQSPWTLCKLYRHVENPGAIVAAYVNEERSWRHFREERNLAVSLAPLYASGHVNLADDLRKKLQQDLAQCIAKMAYAHHKKVGQREALQEAFTPLEGNPSGNSFLYELAVELFGPLGYIREIVALSRASDAVWLLTLENLQKHGYAKVLQEELTPERIEQHRQGVFMHLDGSLWIAKANTSTLIECWLDYWRNARMMPRRRALAGPGDRWFNTLSLLISTLGGPKATETTLREVLHIGEWFA